MDDIGRLGVAQEILRESGLHAADRRASRRSGKSHFVIRLPALHLTFGGYPQDTHTATNRKKKHCNWWCAACGSQHEWRAPNRILEERIGVNANEAKVREAHATPLGLCDNLLNALKLLANQQKDGHSPIQSVVTSLHERSRSGIMDGPTRFMIAPTLQSSTRIARWTSSE